MSSGIFIVCRPDSFFVRVCMYVCVCSCTVWSKLAELVGMLLQSGTDL